MTGPVRPAVVPALDWRFPAVRESRLDSGLRLLVYPCPGQYVVHASLLFDVPLNAEPRHLEGVATLVARCLTRGAGGLSAEEFSDALAASGADLDASASPDGLVVRLSVPQAHLARGLELLGMAVTQPSYDVREFEQEQRLRLQEIDHALAYPGAVAADRLHAALFGEARAARPVGGTPETVAAVSRDDVAEFAERHLVPQRAVLVVAGDLPEPGPEALAGQRLEGWWRRGGPVVLPEVPEFAAAPQVVLVDWPDAPQATLRVAGPGIVRADPRWPSLFVANYAVGGSFSSRLNTVLREQKGLTYGIGSALDAGRGVGLVGVSASVRGDAVAEAVGDVRSILQAARGTITEAEVASGVRAVSDSAPLSFERAETVVARVEMLVSQELPLDHVDANLQRIREVTAESANRAYQEVVSPETFTVVVAADGSAAEALGALGHAPVEVVPRPTPRSAASTG